MPHHQRKRLDYCPENRTALSNRKQKKQQAKKLTVTNISIKITGIMYMKINILTF